MDIMLSVLMTVYNHERYLAKAIEGVLMQKTNFKYELIIGEDCSTDRSREIVVEYQKRHPDIIRGILNPVNLGMDKNAWQVTKAARGRYIAICEGDDYWTDPEKLQIQVDFLEKHREYSGCYHSVDIVDEEDNPRDIGPTPYIIHEDVDYDKESWNKCMLPGQSGSIVMRNIFPDMRSSDLEMFVSARCNGDNKLPILLLCYGKIRKMARVMSCYRRSYTGDSWNARSSRRDMRAYLYINFLERDRMVKHLWGMEYMPHDEARGYLVNVLGDVMKGNDDVGKLLQEMVVYNPWKLIALQIANDLQRLSEWETPLVIDKIIHDTLKKKQYVIFGTGFYGDKCYRLFKALGLGGNIRAFWDNDKKKQGGMFHEIHIEAPSLGLYEGCGILISSLKYGDEMRSQMVDMGYRDEIILDVVQVCEKIKKLIRLSVKGKNYE